MCPAHQHGIYSNPIHPLSEEERFKTVSTGECGAAQLYYLGSEPEVKLNLCFPCEDSCVRGKGIPLKIHLAEFDYISASSRKDARNKKAIEKARDSELVVKLVEIHHDGSTHSLVTECLPVWIKVDIYIRNMYFIYMKTK